jgi:hypothetical protein
MDIASVFLVVVTALLIAAIWYAGVRKRAAVTGELQRLLSGPGDAEGSTVQSERRPSRWATAAASTRLATSSLAMMRETWTLAVFGEM